MAKENYNKISLLNELLLGEEVVKKYRHFDQLSGTILRKEEHRDLKLIYDMVVMNNPSVLFLLIPWGNRADKEYKKSITTQHNTNNDMSLKVPRSVSVPFYFVRGIEDYR